MKGRGVSWRKEYGVDIGTDLGDDHSTGDLLAVDFEIDLCKQRRRCACSASEVKRTRRGRESRELTEVETGLTLDKMHVPA